VLLIYISKTLHAMWVLKTESSNQLKGHQTNMGLGTSTVAAREETRVDHWLQMTGPSRKQVAFPRDTSSSSEVVGIYKEHRNMRVGVGDDGTDHYRHGNGDPSALYEEEPKIIPICAPLRGKKRANLSNREGPQGGGESLGKRKCLEVLHPCLKENVFWTCGHRALPKKF